VTPENPANRGAADRTEGFARALARCPLFAQLDPADLRALAAIAEGRRYAAGQPLFFAGDPPAGLTVVTEGRVKVFVLSPDTGREIILTTEHPFHAVAELPSFDGGSYPANAEAVTDTETLFLERSAFERLLEARPRVALHLLRTLGRRLRRLVGLIEQLSFQEVIGRLAGYLLGRAQTGLPVALETNAAIAAAIGTVPELVSRNLARLHQMGAVVLEQRRIVAVNEALLRELAGQA
jgi:CRP-like cAMP-binding protein